MLAPYTLLSIADMLTLPIGKLVNSYTFIANLNQHLQSGPENLQIELAERDYAELLTAINSLRDTCGDIGLRVTKEAVTTLLDHCNSTVKMEGDKARFDALSLHRVKGLITAIQNCLKNESNLKIALILPPENEDLYEPRAPLYGSDVFAKFPSVAPEIDEAAKCLALGRSTASAFHSIRCLEAGIRAISRCLGIPDPTKGADRNWGMVLKKIQAAVDTRWSNSSHRMHGDGEFMERAYAALAALKNPYRNTTMHLDATYTEEEAKHIREMVGGIMRMIASRMDEQGLPLA